MFNKIYSFIFLVLLILLSACKEEAAIPPTTDPGQLETQVAQEVAVQLTEIALSQPTASITIPPTSTVIEATATATTEPPTALPSPTDTAVPVQASPTTEPASPTPVIPTSSSTVAATARPLPTATTASLACKVIKQTPENGKTIKPKTDFVAVWTVENTSTVVWDENEIDYRYKSGDELHQTEIYDLPKSIQPGESVNLKVEMRTPGEQEEYKTTWLLHQGSHPLCWLTLEIIVEK